MGTYLATGIVHDIAIAKKRIKYPDTTVNKIIQRLKDELNLDYYNFSEDLEGYYWKIKPEMLEENLTEFLSKQFQMYQSKLDSDMEEAIAQLKGANSGEEIIKLAKRRSDVESPFFPRSC